MKKWLSYILLITSLISILVLTFVNSSFYSINSKEGLIINNLSKEIDSSKSIISEIEKKIQIKNFDIHNLRYENNDVFIFDNSKIRYWSNNNYSLESKKILLDNRNLFLQNNEYGKFLILKSKFLIYTTVISIPLVRNYKTRNSYISDKLNQKIFNSLNVEILDIKESNGKLIPYKNNNLFRIKIKSIIEKEESVKSILYFISSIILLLTMFVISKEITSSIVKVSLLVFLRIGLLLVTPSVFSGVLYSPSVFASTYLHPNLADFILNIILVSLIFRHLLIAKIIKRYSSFLIVISLATSFLFINDILMNSTFDISPYSLINFELQSWLLLLPIVYISLMQSITIIYITKLAIDKEFDLWFYLFNILLLILIWIINLDLLLPYIILVLISIVYYLEIFKLSEQVFYFISLLIFSFIITDYKFKKDESGKKLLRLELGSNMLEGSDPYLEYLINDVSERISKDKIIISKLKSPLTSADNLIIKKIKKVYLQNYFEGYEFDIDIISIDQVVRFADEIKVKKDLYKVIKKDFDDLYQIRKEGINLHREYIKLVWFDDANLVKNIFIRFKEKEINKYSVMPKLLLDEGRSYNSLDNISFSLIKDDRIVYQSGEFKINEELAAKVINNEDVIENYYHSVLTQNGESLIVSTKKTTIREFLNYFSFITILLLIFFYGWNIIVLILSKRKLQFAERVQFAMSFFVLLNIVSLLFVVVTSFNSTYKEQISNRYSEIAKNVSTSLKSSLSLKNIRKRELFGQLTLMAKNQNVDVHLYNNDGELLMSSLPAIFDKKLLSKKIDFNHYNQDFVSVSAEKIGEFEFSSAYSPIIKDGKILGVVNIPFFSSDEELKLSINEIVYSVLDVSLIIVILFLLISNFLSNKITKPLKLLKENMESITLSDNRLIEWKSDDEIGGLVKSYNLMLSKLSESKDKLKEQEKQSAWKEMAKQVAHEIKNPLTPMKLSLQFLQRKMSISDHSETKKLSESTVAIIDQIDNLADIVSSFSEFATMPDYKLEKRILNDIIRDSSELHNQMANITLSNFKEEYFVKCDYSALKGIFNNLILNSIQSVNEKQAEIIINCIYNENDKVVIAISDNGDGIPDEIKDEIFVPNFSTKYTGSGIGLALAKQGVEYFGGKIWFETKLHIGTTFYVELPLSR